jgi:hypothetical protein
MVSIAAFVWFWILTYKASTPRHEDWKKFLSSFAGTALALSVGFASIMLQQHNQLQQRQSDEAVQIQRKIAEENGQMKARLLYSITQKKFELQFFQPSASDQEHIGKLCDKNADLETKTEAFKALRDTGSLSDTEFMKDVMERLFSTSSYERNTLNRLLTETGFASRVGQTTLGDFLAKELSLTVAAPRIMPQIFEFLASDQFPSQDRIDRFCTQTENLTNLVGDVMTMQLLSCAAYAIIELPKTESIDRSRKIVDLIQAFAPGNGSADEKAKRIQQLVATLENEVGPAKSDFKTCREFAELELERIPNPPPGASSR